MSDKNQKVPNTPGQKPSQPEGERSKFDNTGDKGTSKSNALGVSKKPSQAEGDEKTIDEALKNQQKKP